jgi:transketolase
MQLKQIVETHDAGLVIMEEHQKSCGAGSAIVECLSDMYSSGEISVYPKVRRLAINDEFLPIVGSQDYLRNVAGLTL